MHPLICSLCVYLLIGMSISIWEKYLDSRESPEESYGFCKMHQEARERREAFCTLMGFACRDILRNLEDGSIMHQKYVKIDQRGRDYVIRLWIPAANLKAVSYSIYRGRESAQNFVLMLWIAKAGFQRQGLRQK